MTPTREELRSLFLFEGLSDEQLDWLAERAELRTYDAGAVMSREGDPATHLLVLVEGGLRLSRLANGEEMVINETTHRGAYGGAVRSYVDGDETYIGSMTATQPSRVLALPAADFRELMRRWFPMAVHLLDGLYVGVRNSEAQVRQREHLASLGTLSANLAHELNNPAAATVRATSQLRSRVAGMRHKLGLLASGSIPQESLQGLVELQERAVEQAAKADRSLGPVEIADLEDAVTDRLEQLGVAAAYELAPVFAASGLDADWVSTAASCVDDAAVPGLREGALRWIAYTLETEALMDEIEDASTRISTLVAVVKDYSHMDAATEQDVDLHAGLDSTLVMLGAKLAGITVVKEYDRELPAVPARPAELNQVWTNLIDNAAAAMAGRGRLVLRTRRDGSEAVVEVADDGPGIPPDVLPRIWDAFFTTKPAGTGSGLGLDNVRRIVDRRHNGTVEVDTGAGGTTFRVRLPLQRAA
jgi:signal transduction histidine kinase